MATWEKITKKLSGIFGAADRAEDTADRVLKMLEPIISYQEPVDPLTEWRDDSAFLASLVAGRKRREQEDHEVAVAEITSAIGHGTQKPLHAPVTARFKPVNAS